MTAIRKKPAPKSVSQPITELEAAWTPEAVLDWREGEIDVLAELADHEHGTYSVEWTEHRAKWAGPMPVWWQGPLEPTKDESKAENEDKTEDELVQ